MRRKVSPEKVAALREYANATVPDLVILYKDEPLPTWWIRVVFLLVRMVGFFSPEWERMWMNSVSNAMGKKYMIFPNRENWSDLSDYSTYVIFRHELVHLQDVRRYGLWFFLSYVLFPLPTLFAGRSHWEFRGYAQNLIVAYEETGEISDRKLEWVGKQYWGSLYFWMWPFKAYVRKKLSMLRDDIIAGRVSGYHPDVKWWKRDASI